MPNPDTHPEKYSTVDRLTDAIADWVNAYRLKFGGAGGLDQCSPDEVSQIAKDLGVSASQLRDIVDKGPGAADLLRDMLVALGADPDALMKRDPATMRDLQRLCAACDHKRRCQHELAAGSAAAHFHEFCPNAFTLDALFAEKTEAAHR